MKTALLGPLGRPCPVPMTRKDRCLKGGKALLSALFILPVLTGCNHVPSQNILGSYFPSWMLCALGGIFLSVLVRQLLARMKVDAFIPARFLVYTALAVGLTFLLWLFWFGN